jgi:branched-chain amino acid transport system ATP-binding protein
MSLEVKNVSKRFGNLLAVNNVSLAVPKGELHAIIGPNGAGKTTFFNLISGFFPPTAGTIWFDGRNITRLSAHRRVVLGMARTFQITEIFPELTVFENVRISAEVAGGYRLRPWITATETADIERRVAETLQQTGLEAKADRLVGELAHGDQRTAEIAMALALRPNLLLLIEHDMRVVFHLAQRITVLDQGSLLAQGTPPEIAASETVQGAYLGKAA